MFNELSVLRQLKNRFKANSSDLVLGIGDDCAAVRAGGGILTLYSSDTLVEGVHFSTSYMTHREISKKAVSVSVSDIAAMGGKPKYFLSTVGFPKCTQENFIDKLLDGFEESSRIYGIELIGGNITSSDKLFIDITVIGEVEEDKIVRRSGASVGDLLFVTGTLGDSAKGLEILSSGNGEKDSHLEHRHKNPVARIETGRILGNLGIATSMIDISDGFLIDLERITLEHGLGAEIFTDKIPLSKKFADIFQSSKEALLFALSGGEDYELLFTAPASRIDRIKELINKSDVIISEVGTVKDKKEIVLYGPDKKIINYRKKGFVHI